MIQKLQNIYSFLNENRSYNMPIQIGAYKMAMMSHDSTFDKVYALLYSILNSQSQLKMDKLVVFFQRITTNKTNLNSFVNFLKIIGANDKTSLTYKALFELLSKQESWGDKTAALFVKAVYHCHVGYAKEFHFWDDAPTELSQEASLFLPVDAVINHVFQELGNTCSKTFKGINKHLRDNFPQTNFEVWDDLWFWGFITQKGSGDTRTMVFNEEKYWNLLDASKDNQTIQETKKLANQFIDLIKQN